MNKVDAEKLLLAMVSAYVWVASSDEVVGTAEYNKFRTVLIESPFATQIVDEDMIEARHTFKDMVSLFDSDYEKAVNLTRNRLKNFTTQPVMAEEIIRISRAAIIADAKINEVEEVVFREIKTELQKD
ncbi:MAG: hypothetical protein HOO06_02445 [Bdellovibrionaceae bacterium]|nr:hypothetical protein [Pseudobdellovibrionaceae bacterium]